MQERRGIAMGRSRSWRVPASLGRVWYHVQQEIIDEIAQELCAFFHQESVLITTGFAKARTIRVEPVEH